MALTDHEMVDIHYNKMASLQVFHYVQHSINGIKTRWSFISCSYTVYGEHAVSIKHIEIKKLTGTHLNLE